MFVSKVSRHMYFAAVLGLVFGAPLAAKKVKANKDEVATTVVTDASYAEATGLTIDGKNVVLKIDASKHTMKEVAGIVAAVKAFVSRTVSGNVIVEFYDVNGKKIKKSKMKIAGNKEFVKAIKVLKKAAKKATKAAKKVAKKNKDAAVDTKKDAEKSVENSAVSAKEQEMIAKIVAAVQVRLAKAQQAAEEKAAA